MTKKPAKKKPSRADYIQSTLDRIKPDLDDDDPIRRKEKDAVLYAEHLTVVLDEKIRSAVRTTIAWLDFGSSLRRQCTFGSSLCEEIFESIGSSISETKEVTLERRIKQLRDLSDSHAVYVKHHRILDNRLGDVVRFVSKIRHEINEVYSARAFQSSLHAMEADDIEFKAACNIVLKEIGRRDPHFMKLVQAVDPLLPT